MRESENLYLFWEHQFGQWTKRDMIDIDGAVYNCCEQYMMAKKALLFADIQTQNKIMQTSAPREQKDLGRTVANFDARTWNEHKFAIVWQANFLKFSQHQDLRERLLNTGDKILAEASPVDLVWGIGFAAKDDEALDQTKWRGQNLLGEVLMSVRDALRKSMPA
jgi:ribA/ribD-fused uncharacterized protein